MVPRILDPRVFNICVSWTLVRESIYPLRAPGWTADEPCGETVPAVRGAFELTRKSQCSTGLVELWMTHCLHESKKKSPPIIETGT